MKRNLWKKIERRENPHPEFIDGDCWEWTGTKANRGYGSIHHNGRDGYLPHRLSYELLVGPIPDGLVLDHLCKNRCCVRPSHLEPVTNRVNILRGEGIAAQNFFKTHCLKGHPFDVSNTKIRKDNSRACRKCERERLQKFRENQGRNVGRK